MRKTILIYGLIPGLLLGIFYLITLGLNKHPESMDMETSMLIGYAAMVLSLGTCMALALRKYKRENPGVGFGQQFLLCLGIAGVTSVVYVVSWACIYHFMIPDWADHYVASMKKRMDAGKITVDDYNEMQSMMKNYDKPVYFTLYTLMEIFPVGLAVGLIASLISFLVGKRKGAANSHVREILDTGH